MTWKERRLITILSAILGVLVIALLIVLGMRYRESRDEKPDASGSALTAAEEGESIYTSLTYSNGSTTLAFHMDENGTWLWSHDETFPLDPSRINEILNVLFTLSPQQTLETVESLESCGLTEPQCTLTAARSDGTETTIAFGNATTEGTSFYALMNGAESPVYIFDGALMELMKMPIYEMCDLPEIPDLSAGRIQKITIQGAPVEEGEPLRVSFVSDGAAWDCDGTDVTGCGRLEGLLEDLAVLKIEQCVDYRPSSEALAICGFDAPAATLWANYTTETDLTENIQLTVGALTLDGAARYVRLNGETTIYRVSTELLDPLMVIALSGLAE